MRQQPVLAHPRAVGGYLAACFLLQEREVLGVLFLDNPHRLLRFDEVFLGTIDGASVHPREVVKLALARNAAAVILAHNHPSGVAEPSQADELITVRIRDALALVDIRVLEHLVVGGNTVTSFAEHGLIWLESIPLHVPTIPEVPMIRIRGPDRACHIIDPNIRELVEQRFAEVCNCEPYDPDVHGEMDGPL